MGMTGTGMDALSEADLDAIRHWMLGAISALDDELYPHEIDEDYDERVLEGLPTTVRDWLGVRAAND
jgi:hypothetical protein